MAAIKKWVIFNEIKKRSGVMQMRFGEYLVVKEKSEFFAVYDCSSGVKELMTHQNNWRKATKIAKLLNIAYEMGYKEAKDIFG